MPANAIQNTSSVVQSPELVALQQIEAELNQELLERDEAVRAALLAVLAQAHLILLGAARHRKVAFGDCRRRALL